MAQSFQEFKSGDKVSLTGDIFKGDREHGVTQTKVVFVDNDKIAVEFPHRGWLPKDNSIASQRINQFDSEKKYFWVFAPEQITKIEEDVPKPVVKETPKAAAPEPLPPVTQAKIETVKVNIVTEPITKDTNQNKETKHMTLSISDQFKVDSVSAGYRAGGRKLTEFAQKGLIALMKSTGAKRKDINAMLLVAETTIGRALIGQLLGQGLTRFPGLQDNPKIQRLAEELRIESIANGMEMTFDALVSKLAPRLLGPLEQIMSELPDPEVKVESKDKKQVRVVPLHQEEQHEEEEEETQHVAAKRHKA